MSSDGTTILFGLPEARVREVVRVPDGTRMLHVVTDEEAAAACPACGVLSISARQRRVTRPRDLPYGEEGCWCAGARSSTPAERTRMSAYDLTCRWAYGLTCRSRGGLIMASAAPVG
ncbi:protein of unknown function [Blastococcus saxobsidens DD2]|uniref:Transposase n=1 Tax=Blastococcus saxobsidens (strain DD2) TaxID=1146883 RepID=H6RNR5_BLASD|nr:protein of unknown function [Blastococcus saxobsidens DD2]